MSPAPVLPDTTSELTRTGVFNTVAKTAPSVTNGFVHHHHGTSATLPELDASLLRFNLTSSPRRVPEPNSPEVLSMKTCTDHMITASWTLADGWAAPEMKPYGPLAIMPTASVLHYATECFEGLKLYRGHDGRLRLFRPSLNCRRMLMSSTRIALPGFPPDELLKLITKLCAVDGPKWLPKSRPGTFLYVRPTMIANDSALGVQKPKEALLYVILACFPTLDRSAGPNPGMKLLASQDDMVRAWPGGFGYAKVGANYGPTLLAQGEARQRGYDQVLWLFGENCMVTEAGASNFFVVWRTREGRMQLVTAPLDERIILDGITRRSMLELARERLVNGWHDIEPLEVVERRYGMSEIVEAVQEGRMIEAFAAGTAFFVAPVSEIHFRGVDLPIPLAAGNIGRYTGLLKTWLMNIMYGKERHEWGYVVDEEG